ncbi:MAG: nucleotidyltransferase substrate binding protein [Limisphaerales bacterium]
MSNKLVLTPFEKALETLEQIVVRPVDDIVRDATIQRFEYTYELAWKMIKRHLDWSGYSDTASLSKRDLFREAAKTKLIANADAWFDYHQARNETSHTYELKTAEEVYEAAVKFAPDARALLTELKKHHG